MKLSTTVAGKSNRLTEEILLSALIDSLFSLAAKSVQADTSVADIQKEVELVAVKIDVPNFGYKDPKTGTYSGIKRTWPEMIDEPRSRFATFCYHQTRGPLIRQRTGRHDIATSPSQTNVKNYTTSPVPTTRCFWFFVNKSANIKSIEDLNGKTIGVAQGSSPSAWITELGKKKGLNF